MVGVVQEALPRMPKGRMSDVMTERDGVDKVEVKAECPADVSCHAAHQLHVQASPTQVVVRPEREDLRLAGKTVVRGHVQDLLSITHEGGAKRRVKVALRKATDGREVLTGKRTHLPCPVPSHLALRLRGERVAHVRRKWVHTYGMGTPLFRHPIHPSAAAGQNGRAEICHLGVTRVCKGRAARRPNSRSSRACAATQARPRCPQTPQARESARGRATG